MQVKTKKAYLESDIIWENVAKNQKKAMMKRAALFILLVIFSLVVLTPTYAISLLDPLKFAIHDVIKVTWVQQMITTYFSPLIVILVNFVIIPCLIDFSVLYEDHRRHSGVQVSIIKRIYFFMLFNTLIFPVTATSTALVLAEKLSTNITNWPSMLASNMMAQQYFYIKFIIQLTFISNGLCLIDAPHRITAWIKKYIHEKS